MESGIITKTGKFIRCEPWRHGSTALHNDTGEGFLICRLDTIDIIGDINGPMVDALFEYCARNGVIAEKVASSDLEEALGLPV